MKFAALLAAHLPGDPAEATLVLAAAAALNGLSMDGSPMPGGFEREPSMRDIARELGVSIGAVRRGVTYLAKANVLAAYSGPVSVDPEALAARWQNYRQRIRLTAEARTLRMRPRPLLLTGLVAGQVDEHGQLRLGLGFLMERTGFARRSLQRALATAVAKGAIHTWVVPPNWQLHLALGPSPNGARRASQSGARRAPSVGEKAPSAPVEEGDGRETAQTPIANRHTPRRESAQTPSRNGARPPDVHPDVHPDSPTESPASPAGVTKSQPDADQPRSSQARPAVSADIADAVDTWVRECADQWWLSATDDRDVSRVATLVDSVSPRPPVVHDRVAFFKERLELARRIIRWCPSPERLGRWLVRASRWFGVENLGAYLRAASGKGDPGTLLESHTKNRLGRGAETLQDFAPGTEQALNGPRADEVAHITASLAAATRTIDEAERTRLRDELLRYWQARRPVAARAVLLKLVGDTRSDIAIQGAVDGILPLIDAKRLLGVA